jgi:hypothetical protein
VLAPVVERSLLISKTVLSPELDHARGHIIKVSPNGVIDLTMLVA